MAVSEAAYQLGMTHFRYAEYGLKPHFLDLWRQHLETVRFVRSLKAVDIRESQIVSENSKLLFHTDVGCLKTANTIQNAAVLLPV